MLSTAHCQVCPESSISSRGPTTGIKAHDVVLLPRDKMLQTHSQTWTVCYLAFLCMDRQRMNEHLKQKVAPQTRLDMNRFL